MNPDMVRKKPILLRAVETLLYCRAICMGNRIDNCQIVIMNQEDNGVKEKDDADVERKCKE